MQSMPKYRVTVQLGSKSREWDVYVAPITDPFLMGLDFMLAAHVTVLGGGQVLADGEPVETAIVSESMEKYAVSRVLLQKTSTLPAARGPKCNTEDPPTGQSAMTDLSAHRRSPSTLVGNRRENSTDAELRAGDPDVTGGKAAQRLRKGGRR